MTKTLSEQLSGRGNKQMIMITKEQQQIIQKYFNNNGEQYFISTAGLHLGLFEFTISRDTPVVLEIKVNHTVITMWKNVHQLHITIL
jgi:hypothetical protein